MADTEFTEADAARDKQLTDWRTMKEKVIRADEVLSGDVTNGFNKMGNVRDLVLTPDRKRVEYILYEVPFPYGYYGAQDGYVAFDNVAFENTVTADLNIRIDDEQSMADPETLKLTREEANNRLLSRIQDESLVFGADDNVMREVEDLLINRQTGEITHYVIAMDEESLFNVEPRAIPVENIRFDTDNNRLVTDVRLDNVEQMAYYAPEFLK